MGEPGRPSMTPNTIHPQRYTYSSHFHRGYILVQNKTADTPAHTAHTAAAAAAHTLYSKKKLMKKYIERKRNYSKLVGRVESGKEKK